MDELFTIAAIVAIFVGCGVLIGLFDPKRWSVRWLMLAAVLVIVEDVLLTNAYGLVPNVIPGSWNWQGKALTLVVLLLVASRTPFSWTNVGLNLRQREGSLLACLPVAAFYLIFFVAIALVMPNEPFTSQDVAFQLTMPGLEEELFYRGILLFALNEAFRRRWRFLGVEWGWSAILSSILFGLAHAFQIGDGAVSFDPLYFALTAVPSLLGVWLRERSGSLVLPIVVHNAGNLIPMLL